MPWKRCIGANYTYCVTSLIYTDFQSKITYMLLIIYYLKSFLDLAAFLCSTQINVVTLSLIHCRQVQAFIKKMNPDELEALSTSRGPITLETLRFQF